MSLSEAGNGVGGGGAAAERLAVVLLSGGLDSSTVLAIARADGFQPYAISFRYGQRHGLELERARAVARALGAREHLVVEFDLRSMGGSALTAPIDVPKDRSDGEIGRGIPVTYVPARNTIFLSFALGWAEVLGVRDIYLGVNAVDHSGYPDCRAEFVRAFEGLANLATKAGVEGDRFRVHAPLVTSSKGDIVRRALALRVPLELTWSCYDPQPGERACGRCDSCILRLRGFREAGATDPIPYAPQAAES